MTRSDFGVTGEGLFALGWACADEAHMPALPEALAHLLHVPAARIALTQWDGKAVCEFTWSEDPGTVAWLARADDLTEELALGSDYLLRVSVASPDGGFSQGQKDTFHLATVLMREGLECILVRQKDRLQLGGPFGELSDREWMVLQALEGPQGEKEIAHTLACSRHTVHSYVKGVYRKMRLRSRLHVLGELRKSREALRCAAVGRFSLAARVGRTRKNGGHPLEPASN